MAASPELPKSCLRYLRDFEWLLWVLGSLWFHNFSDPLLLPNPILYPHCGPDSSVSVLTDALHGSPSVFCAHKQCVFKKNSVFLAWKQASSTLLTMLMGTCLPNSQQKDSFRFRFKNTPKDKRSLWIKFCACSRTPLKALSFSEWTNFPRSSFSLSTDSAIISLKNRGCYGWKNSKQNLRETKGNSRIKYKLLKYA